MSIAEPHVEEHKKKLKYDGCFPEFEENIWGEPKRGKGMNPWIPIVAPPMTLLANKDNQVPLASGVECVGVHIQNNSPNDIYRAFDSPAGPGSWKIPAGGDEYLDVYCTVLHIYVTADTLLNNVSTGSGVVVEAGLQP